jgi:hypothetical protein
VDTILFPTSPLTICESPKKLPYQLSLKSTLLNIKSEFAENSTRRVLMHYEYHVKIALKRNFYEKESGG